MTEKICNLIGAPSNDKTFPSGYKWKALSKGDTWPGFGDNVIPICMDNSVSGDVSGSVSGTLKYGTMGSQGKELGIDWNGSNVVWDYAGSYFSAPGYATVNSSYSKAYAASVATSLVFLPVKYNWDFKALQAAVKSGTITVWLEK